METSCHLDGTLFPFDSQTCSIVIMSWAYSEDFVDLRNASNYIHLDGFNDDSKPYKYFYCTTVASIQIYCLFGRGYGVNDGAPIEAQRCEAPRGRSLPRFLGFRVGIGVKVVRSFS